MTVDATTEDWAVFLTTARQKRRLPAKGVRLEGAQREIKRFIKAFAAKPAAR